MGKTFYEKWCNSPHRNLGNFEGRLMLAYNRAKEEDMIRLQKAYPEYFGQPKETVLNTILVTGSYTCYANYKVLYNVLIWASRAGEAIQCIATKELTDSNHAHLWEVSKKTAVDYFKDDKFSDGAYTQYHDHLIGEK